MNKRHFIRYYVDRDVDTEAGVLAHAPQTLTPLQPRSRAGADGACLLGFLPATHTALATPVTAWTLELSEPFVLHPVSALPSFTKSRNSQAEALTAAPHVTVFEDK